MFWKRYKHNDNNYGYFGIGFMASGKVSDINYPNTFFFRLDDDYIYYQKRVLPYSIMKKDKNGKRTFEIYWNQVWQGLEKNMHYKKLKNTFALRNGMIDIESIKNSSDVDVLRHYELLQLDALDKVYLPYMKKDFRWTNDEKRFVLKKIKAENGRDLFPNEVRQILSEYRQSVYTI